jgi:hypothetical protein
MVKINNIYGHGFDDQQIDFLREMGFHFRPRVSRFAGSQVLHFVDFHEGPSLEFIQVENENEYDEFLPEGMVPYCPGINLIPPDDPSRGLESLQDELSEWSPYSKHVNYDGVEELGKPGWNYLNFEIPIVQDTFIWFTESEEPKPRIHKATNHPNKVDRVIGLTFNLDEGEVLSLARIIGSEFKQGTLDIGGVRAFSRESFHCSKELPDKKFPLVNIILKADPVDSLQATKGLVEDIDCFSKPARYIQMNELCWDLIVTT